MSTLVMSVCWPLEMSPAQKAVLISLADNANDEGYCWPSIETICTRTCLGRTAVITAIHSLEESGLLQADRSNGRKSTYIVLPGQLPPVREANRYASRTGSRNDRHQSARRTGPVRLADTNRNYTSLTVTTTPTAPDVEKGWGVPKQIAEHLLAQAPAVVVRKIENSDLPSSEQRRHVLLEVLGLIKAGKARSPLALADALLARAKAGAFALSAGLSIEGEIQRRIAEAEKIRSKREDEDARAARASDPEVVARRQASMRQAIEEVEKVGVRV